MNQKETLEIDLVQTEHFDDCPRIDFQEWNIGCENIDLKKIELIIVTLKIMKPQPNIKCMRRPPNSNIVW